MNWEDERYARLYVRDTVTWKMWDWRARFVLMSMLRKADRSGVIDVGGEGCDGLAAVLEMPVDIVRDGVPQLEARGTLRCTATAFVLVNFMHAQECRQSDVVRQQLSRERRRTDAMTDVDTRNHSGDKTNGIRPSGDEVSPDPPSPVRNVTDRHSFLAVPSLAVPSVPERRRRAPRVKAAGAAPPRLLSSMDKGWCPRTGEAPAGLDFNRELQRFRDHYISEGKRKADWNAAWRNWLRRAEEYAVRDAPRGNGNSKHPAVGRVEPSQPHEYNDNPFGDRMPWEDDDAR